MRKRPQAIRYHRKHIKYSTNYKIARAWAAGVCSAATEFSFEQGERRRQYVTPIMHKILGADGQKCTPRLDFSCVFFQGRRRQYLPYCQGGQRGSSGNYARQGVFTPPKPAHKKKADRVQPAFQNLYQTKRREAPLSEGGHLYSRAKPLSDCSSQPRLRL